MHCAVARPVEMGGGGREIYWEVITCKYIDLIPLEVSLASASAYHMVRIFHNSIAYMQVVYIYSIAKASHVDERDAQIFLWEHEITSVNSN